MPETWDGDAFIKIEGSKLTMYSEEGKLCVMITNWLTSQSGYNVYGRKPARSRE